MPELWHSKARQLSREAAAAQARRGLAVTAGALVGLTSIKLVFYEVIGAPTPFLLYFGAIIAAAWFDGYRGGLLLTLAAALLGGQLFIVAEHTEPSDWFATLAQVAVFLVEGVVMTAIIARMRAEQTRASSAAADAERTLAKLSAILDGVSDGITVQGPDGELIYANALAANMCGYASVNELLAAPLTETQQRVQIFDVHAEPFPLEELPGRRVLRGLPAQEQLLCFRLCASGEERWARVRANPVHIQGDARRYAVIVLQDVTTARDHEAALRVSEARFATTLRSLGEAVIATDARACVTFMNDRAQELSGVTLAAAEGRPFSEVFRLEGEDGVAMAESPVQLVLRSGQSVQASRSVLCTLEGRKVAVDGNAAPIRSGHGPTAGAVMVLRDISERRADERRRRFIALAVSELSASLTYEETLPRVAQLAVPELADCFVIDALLGDSSRRLAAAHVDPEKLALLRKLPSRYPQSQRKSGGAFAAALNGSAVFLPRVQDSDLQGAAQDAGHLALLRELRCASCIVAPLSVEGRVFGVLILATMLPRSAELEARYYDQKDFELALALADRVALAIHHARLYSEATAARRDAEQASRTKDEFLAMLGHELRNPLAPITTALQLMKLRAPEALSQERAVLERQVAHLVTLVSDLLDVSRIARGKLELKREPVELTDTLSTALELAAPLLEQRRHRVTTEVPRGLVVHGDRVRLAQVLSNLLNNAAKYTEPGGHIHVSAKREDERVQLCVRDTGAGIPTQLLPQVFDMFVQGKQALDRAEGGLGLGLAIVRNVVELHGGRVSAHSEGLGQGSEFRVELPLLSRPSQIEGAAPAHSERPAATGATVLVVDDNEDALTLLAEVLALQGYRTHTASDPAEALLLAAQLRPDVALLDIGLPVMDGYELARQLRAQKSLMALKLVAITGYGQPSDREQARDAGFDEHLVKPVRVEDLQRVLSRLLDDSTQDRA